MELAKILKFREVKVALLIAVAVILYVGCKKGIDSSELAAWVQAIGALSAVWLAVYLSKVTSDKEDERKKSEKTEADTRIREDRRAQVQAVCLVGENLCKALERGYGELSKGAKGERKLEKLPVFEVKRGREAVGKIPTHQIPYVVVGDTLLDLTVRADQYVQLINALRDLPLEKRPPHINTIMGQNLAALEKIKAIGDALKDKRTSCDGQEILPLTAEDL